MLVDDSLVVRSILERIVDQTAGLQVCASVASAHDALAVLACEPVDVVVLDIEMPGLCRTLNYAEWARDARAFP